MNLFIKNAELKEDRIIMCPFGGISWDGTYPHLRSILKEYAVENGKIIPFILSNNFNKVEIIFHHKRIHDDALDGSHSFFMFENKKLLKSASNLRELLSVNELE